MAYLGCAAALGYGVLKLVWSLGGTVGLDHPERFRVSPQGLTAAQRWFDYWGTPVLAGLAVVILLGLVYPWGNVRIVRPALRALAWAGTLVAVWGVAGLIVMIQYYAGHLNPDRWLIRQATSRSSPPPSCSSMSASWCWAWHSAQQPGLPGGD